MTDHADEMTEAERIRRLEHRCTMEASHIAELKEQVKALRAERDALRRILARINSDPTGYANAQGCD